MQNVIHTCKIAYDSTMQRTRKDLANLQPHYKGLINEVIENKALAEAYENALEPYIKKVNPDHKFKNYAERVVYEKSLALVDYLYVTTRILKPRCIIETGCATGYASSLLLAAIEKNNLGHLYTIDLPLEFGKSDVTGFNWPDNVPVGYLVPEAYRKNWTLSFADCTIELPQRFAEIGKGNVDFFFHDSDHSYEHMMFEFALAQKFMSAGSLIVSDDIEINAAFQNFFAHNNISTYTTARNTNIGSVVLR